VGGSATIIILFAKNEPANLKSSRRASSSTGLSTWLGSGMVRVASGTSESPLNPARIFCRRNRPNGIRSRCSQALLAAQGANGVGKSERLHSIRLSPNSLLFAVLLGCAVVLAVLWTRGWEAGRCNVCVGNLHGIGALLRNYRAVHGTYPPLADECTADAPVVSWRVLILLLGQHLDVAYRLDEPWDSPHNRSVIADGCSRSFSCPSDFAAKDAGRTSYLAVVGEGTVWSEVRLGHIRDPEKETPQKIVVIEVPDSGIYWTEPGDISVDEAIALFRAENGLKNSRHRKGLHYLTADGTVHNFDEIGSTEEFGRLLRATE